MSSERPEISIVIPIYNRAGLLPATLNSLRNQNFQSWECLLVDDHSTDSVETVCKQYCTLDTRFSYQLNQRVKGAPGARNTGIERARGKFTLLFDADNLLHPEMLETMFQTIQEAEADIAVCFARVTNDAGERIGQFHWICEGKISEALKYSDCYVDNNLALIRTDLLKKIGYTDEDCPAYQEWDTHLRLSEFGKYVTVQTELVDYVRYSNGTISQDADKSVNGYLYVLEKHRNSFRENPIRFRAIGVAFLESMKDLERPDLEEKTLGTLNQICPGFEKHWRSEKWKNRFNQLKHSIKSVIRKPKK